MVMTYLKHAMPLHGVAHYKIQQAVTEWGWDAKIGERRAVHKAALRDLNSRVFS